MFSEILVDAKSLVALETLDGQRGIVEPLGADQVVDQKAHQTLLRLRVLVAAVAEKLLCFFVVERTVDGLVGGVLVVGAGVLHQLVLGQVQFETNVAHTEI